MPLAASDGTITYAGSAHYAPQGALAYVQNGTNLYTTQIYNSRLQPCWIYSTTGSALTWNTTACTATDPGPANIIDLQYNFALGAGDNGNVIGITNNRDTTRSQAFSYDALNRLLTAETTSTYSTSPAHCWGEAYFYDNQPSGSGAWGNLTSIGGASSSYNGCTQEGLSVTATTNNQISGFCYDAAGNLLQESTCPAGPPYTYTYNAEHQITSTAGVTYSYDGDGKRIEKSGGKIYWYGGGSTPLDETDLSGNTNNSTFSEYVYFGGARTSRRDYQGNIFYYFADHLGTSREMVQSGQTSPCYDADFYPFGGERTYTTTCTQNYKFTSKERDSESGLDYFGARYNSSAMGRFMSPDPKQVGAHPLDPQTLNRYTYTRNSPLAYVDPDGKDFAKAWADVKTFVNSISIKVSGCVCLYAKGKVGVFEAKAGAAAKVSIETSTAPGAPAATISRSAEIGATAGPTDTSGIKVGEGISAEQTLVKVNSVTSVDTRPEVPKVDITDTIGGHTTPNAPDDKVGIGFGAGEGLGAEGEINTTREGIAALKEAVSEVKDSLKNPGPPPPPPPPRPPT